MSNKRTIAILAVISASLYGFDASAREAEAPKPRSVYFGLGGEGTHASLSEVYKVRAAQRDNTPLQYLEPLEETQSQNSENIALFVGTPLTSWLDVELAWHDMGAFWQVESYTQFFDSSLSGNVQSTTAEQYSRFESSVYSLSLLPRWEIHDYFTLYGRLGVGYADTVLRSSLMSKGWVSSTETCSTGADGNRTCTTSNTYEERDWGDLHQRRTGIIPIVGIGVQIAQVVRLEYMLRADVPIGNATTEISSNLFLSFRVKTAWLDG